MTYQADERDSLIASYKDGVMEANPGYSTEEINDRTREQFREEDNPRILIVTDKLLTGFDAPILQTMYLDKPLRNTGFSRPLHGRTGRTRVSKRQDSSSIMSVFSGTSGKPLKNTMKQTSPAPSSPPKRSYRIL